MENLGETSQQEQFNIAESFDVLFFDVIERHNLQVWPNREKGTKHGKVISWTVSCAQPFIQVTKPNLKAAIVKFLFLVGEIHLDIDKL